MTAFSSRRMRLYGTHSVGARLQLPIQGSITVLAVCVPLFVINEYMETQKIFRAAAEIEGLYYGALTRVEEVALFAKKIGAKKVGLATCMGLRKETQTFAKILKAKGIESVSAVVCKVGAVDKCEIGIPDNVKVRPGEHESTCNPIMQAKILNDEGTDLNVIVGLCCGHDTLFIKHSDAPVTYLLVKDRVLMHNPAAALYGSSMYYRRVMAPGFPPCRETESE